MAIKLKYDQDADRMRLSIDQPDSSACIFWLRRNQCLSLLARLSDVAKAMDVSPQESELLKLPPVRLPKNHTILDVEPLMLKVVRVRVDGEQAVIQLHSEDKRLGVALNGTAVRRLQEMIATQAERAGWDPEVGIKRLRAMAQARKAIAQSQSRTAGPAEK
jgi:hypothetical protein